MYLMKTNVETGRSVYRLPNTPTIVFTFYTQT